MGNRKLVALGVWRSKGFTLTIYLELKAIWLGLKSLCNNLRHKHIRIQSDNTTAVAYINAMGGIKSADCNNMARQI